MRSCQTWPRRRKQMHSLRCQRRHLRQPTQTSATRLVRHELVEHAISLWLLVLSLVHMSACTVHIACKCRWCCHLLLLAFSIAVGLISDPDLMCELTACAGIPFNLVPQTQGLPINLFHTFGIVLAAGGGTTVTNEKRWPVVTNAVLAPRPPPKGMSLHVRHLYEVYLQVMNVAH